jgi:hypothetical protein
LNAEVPDDFPASRRARPTIRCLTEDLGLQLPGLDVDLGDVEDPWLDELRRIAPGSPQGQKRILSIAFPLVFRLRFSDERGATWLDENQQVVWLCGVHRRKEDSDDDAFTWFAGLHADNQLLPSDDDRLRDRVEAVIRFHKELTADLLKLVDRALASGGEGGWLPCRALVISSDDLEETWCALSVRGNNDVFVREEQRDLLFAELERHLHPVMFEARSDWPTGDVAWWEVVRFGVR